MKRVNFVTLGVRDLEESKVFFAELFNWRPTQKDSAHIAFFDMGGWILSLFPREHLAADAMVENEGNGFQGITLAHNVSAKHQVAEVLAAAQKLGATIIKPAQDVFWGGHSGYFVDLDGHYWEIAWNPFMPVKLDGTLDVKSET